MEKENTYLEPGRWLTAEDFKRLTAKHVQEAARVVASGTVKRRFRNSTDYDVVLDDGKRLAPKEVLGVAARLGLGLDVGPSHFRGGEGTPCFRTIWAAGLRIEPKKVDTKVPIHSEDEWFEGHPKRELHLRYERNRKAVQEKKDALRKSVVGWSARSTDSFRRASTKATVAMPASRSTTKFPLQVCGRS